MVRTSANIQFRAERFENIKSAEIGFAGGDRPFIINVKYHEGGSYFTCIPISPLAYRKQHATKAGFQVISSRQVVVYDDWGHAHRIRVEEHNGVQPLIENMLRYELPEVDPTR